MSAWERFWGMFDAVAGGYLGAFIWVVALVPLYYLLKLIFRGRL